MLRLIIMRHAKSDWQAGLPDHERPLNKRGRRDAPRIADAIRALGWAPDLVVCSDSRRTSETWERMAGVFEADPPIVYTRALYHAGLGALQEQLGGVSSEFRTILVLGHNPGWERAAGALSGLDLAMTTANAVLLEMAGDTWAEAITRPAARLETILRPKSL